MPRKKTKTHDEWIEIWHLEYYEPGSRYYKLVQALAEEEAFNEPRAHIAVSDDSTLFCNSIG